MRTIALVVATWLLAGCYAYSPLATDAARGGADIRVALTDAGARELASYLGRDVETVDGRLVASDSAGLTLSVRTTTTSSGVESYWRGERVLIPAAVVASTQVRRLSRTRSALVAAGIVAGAAAIGTAATVSTRGSRGGRGDRPPG